MPISTRRRASGAFGGLLIQLTSGSPVVFLATSGISLSDDPRLAEDTESDDIGSHFSPSQNSVPSGTIMVHRADDNIPEVMGLIRGQEIWRVWQILGDLTILATRKGNLLFRTTVASVEEAVETISSNIAITIAFQGGAVYRLQNLPVVGSVPTALTANPGL